MTSPLEFRFPPEPEYLRALRQQLRHKLQEFGAPDETVDNVLLVLDEIVSNAIEHGNGYRSDAVQLLVRLQAHDRDVVIEFEDPDVPEKVVDELAEALLSGGVDRPPVESERGRGLFLIVHCVDHLRVSRRPDGGLHLHGRFEGALA